MKQETLTIITSALALCGVIYGIATADLVSKSSEINDLDERIMELQYQIDLEQENYSSCEAIMANAHDNAEAYRKQVEELQKEKARLVGLEMETLQSQKKK